MAKKADGRVGKALTEPTVTGEGGGRLPKARTTTKKALAIHTLSTLQLGELEGNNHKELYRILRYFRYKWNGVRWRQTWPDWIEIVGHKGLLDIVRVKNGETEK